LDYVCGWYLKAAHYLVGSKVGEVSRDRKQFADVKFSSSKTRNKSSDAITDDMFVSFDNQDAADRSKVRCAFVSTNSITQGEQVGLLWSEMQRMGIHIQFAHRTFQWTNEAPGKAAVHCVIVGFGLSAITKKIIFDYANPKSEPVPRPVNSISAYLSQGENVLLQKRSIPICPVPAIVFGSKAVDFGHFVIAGPDLPSFLAVEPLAEKYIKEFIGGEEFLNGTKRYCLWLKGLSPQALKAMPSVCQRIESVRTERAKSVKLPTRKLANTPAEFGEDRQPTTPYLLIPKVSSESRDYLPLGFYQPEVIINPTVLVVPNAGLFEFGVLQSHMHMAWMRFVCGRLESRYQYSAQIVYNNFPWPSAVNLLPNRPFAHTDHVLTAIKIIAIVKTDLAVAKLIARIEAAAQAVLDARAVHQTLGASATLAQLYDPSLMPANLAKAHAALDKAVDAAYLEDGGQSNYANDGERVAFLFKRYAALTSLV